MWPVGSNLTYYSTGDAQREDKIALLHTVTVIGTFIPASLHPITVLTFTLKIWTFEIAVIFFEHIPEVEFNEILKYPVEGNKRRLLKIENTHYFVPSQR